MSISRKKTIGLLSAAVTLFSCIMLGIVFHAEKQIIMGMGILVSSLILWSTEALPMAITTMLMICILEFANIMTFTESVENIGVNTSLFIMASSGITIAVGSSVIPQSLTKYIITSSSGNPRRFVLYIGFIISICSAFMSSLATCALFNSILLPMLKNKYKPGNSNLGKCLMIAIPACAGIGGFMSPAGTPANILLLDLLAHNNVNLSFIQWCFVGFPIGLIAVGIFLLSLVIMFPPEPFVSLDSNNSDISPELNVNDKKTIIIVGCIIILWFASGWVSSLNTTLIAVIGLAVMFMPGINLLDWKKFSNGVNWDLVITMGTVSVLMTGIAKTGLMKIVSTAVINQISQLPMLLSIVALSLMICIIRSFIPTTTAVVALLAPMLIEASYGLNTNSLALLLILAFWTASALLIVYTEPIFLITYGNHYYKGKDLVKAGFIPCIVLSFVTALAIPAIVSFLQLG